ncbi:MAG: hypothetical protein PHF84_04240 [bacterium]|nr:hypothetical protein [bacterium]
MRPVRILVFFPVLFFLSLFNGYTIELDTTFNSTGLVIHNNAAGGSGYDSGYAIVIDASNRILISGESEGAVTSRDMAVWRYLANGTLDTAFSNKGWTVHRNAAGGNLEDDGRGIAVDKNGRILIAGKSYNGANYDMAIWRFNPDGSLDTTFSNKGFFIHHGAAGGNGDDWGSAIVIDASNRILVSGGSRGATHDMTIWRFNTNGSLDTSFSNKGWTFHHNAAGGNGGDSGEAIALDRNGKILTTGPSLGVSANYDMVIWRYNPDGSLDTTFSNKGWVFHRNAAGFDGADSSYAVTTDSSNRILVTGESFNGSDYDLVIWRYNPDGSIDTNFNHKGWAVYTNIAGGSGNEYGYGIAVDTNNRIWVTGGSAGSGTGIDMILGRFLSNGTADTAFSGNGWIIYAGAGSNDEWGEDIHPGPGNRVYVIGKKSNGVNDDMAIWCYRDGTAATITSNTNTTEDEEPAGDLGQVKLAPNPFRPNSGQKRDHVIFYNLTRDFRIKVLTLTGKEVADIRGNTSTGMYTWQVKDSKDDPLKPGVYICRVSNSQGMSRDLKLVVIR